MSHSASTACSRPGHFARALPSIGAVLTVLLMQPAQAQEWPDPNFNAAFWKPGWQSSYFIGSTAINEEAKAVARTSDGSYIVAGRVPDPNSYVGVDIGLVKYKSDGTVDLSFGGLGNVHGDPVSASLGKVLYDAYLTDVTDMTLDSLGRIIVVGPAPTGLGGDSDFAVVRFLADGSDVDTSFSNDGGAVVGFDFGGDNNDTPVAVLTDEQDRVIVAGNISSGHGACAGKRSIGMARLNANGGVDTSFGNQSPRTGLMADCHGSDSFAEAFARFAGSFAIGVTYDIPGSTALAMAVSLVDIDGDTAHFSTGVDIPAPAAVNSVRASAMVVQSSTELIVAGNALNNNVPEAAVVCRVYSTTGQNLYFDPTFGPNCYVSPGSNANANGIAVYSDRSVEVVGNYVGSDSIGMTLTLSSEGSPVIQNLWHAPRHLGPDLSFSTSFARVILDHDQPVIVGYRADSSTTNDDHDFVTLRLKTDLIFANDFQ